MLESSASHHDQVLAPGCIRRLISRSVSLPRPCRNYHRCTELYIVGGSSPNVLHQRRKLGKRPTLPASCQVDRQSENGHKPTVNSVQQPNDHEDRHPYRCQQKQREYCENYAWAGSALFCRLCTAAITEATANASFEVVLHDWTSQEGYAQAHADCDYNQRFET